MTLKWWIAVVVVAVCAVALLGWWSNSVENASVPEPRSTGVPSVDAAEVTAAATRQAAAESAAAAERSSRRTAAVAIGAGLLAFTSLIVSIGTYRHTLESHREEHAARIAERADARFAKAIEHLADRDHESVRIGGIHVLEALAVENSFQRPIVGAILMSFTRPWRREWMDAWLARKDGPDPPGPEECPPDISEADAATARLHVSTEDGRGAHLPGAWLPLIDLSDHDLHGSGFERAFFSHAKLARADFSGSSMTEVTMSWTDAAGAKFAEADLQEARLTGSDFTGADFTGAHLLKASMGGTDLIGAVLHEADLVDACLVNADLTDAKLTGAALMGARFPAAKLIRADVTGADMTDTDLTGADARGIVGWGTHESHPPTPQDLGALPDSN